MAAPNFSSDLDKVYTLEKGTELRFEVDWNEKVVVKLLSGMAEIFGTEIVEVPDYTFNGGSKIAVFTYHGCSIKLIGKCKVAYVASETPMMSYLKTHFAIQRMREQALVNPAVHPSPRILIVGPMDCGKTTLSKILISYSSKQGYNPIYVDLDPNEGNIVVPTVIGAVHVERTDVEELNIMPTNTSPPLLYYFGHHTPRDNPKMFKAIISKLARVVETRVSHLEPKEAAAGFIIDTFPWNDDSSIDLLQHAVKDFNVNMILVVGSERIYNEIQQKFANGSSRVDVVKLAKSEGAVDRDKTYRRQMQMRKIREYFYGSPQFELSPYSTILSFNDVQIRRIGEVAAPDSALPIGATRKVDETQLITIEPGDILLNNVLAVSNSDSADDTNLAEINLAGFVYVSEVDPQRKRMVVLAPNPGKIPKRFFWLGTLRWIET